MGERGGRIWKGTRAGNRTWDARNAKALYVGALPIRLSAPTVQVCLINIIVVG